jgi:hypothetical protein
VPLRDPLSVAVSWYRRPRGKPVRFLLLEFEQLARIVAEARNVRYVCMDQPARRQDQLEALAAEFGYALAPIGPPPEVAKPKDEALEWLTEAAKPLYSMSFMGAYYAHRA